MDALLWAVFFAGVLMGAGWALVQVFGAGSSDGDEWGGETRGIGR